MDAIDKYQASFVTLTFFHSLKCILDENFS